MGCIGEVDCMVRSAVVDFTMTTGAGWESMFRLTRKGFGKSECAHDEEEINAEDEGLLVHEFTGLGP